MLTSNHVPDRRPDVLMALVLALLFVLAGSLIARGAEPDADRDRRARAALALAGTARPPVGAAPAPRPAPADYPTGYRAAADGGRPLVVFVGCRADHPAAGALVARADALPGVPGPAAVVLYPSGGKLYTHATLACPVEEARLKAAVEAAAKKVDSPKVADRAAPPPLDWDVRAEPAPEKNLRDLTKVDPRAAIARVRVDLGDRYHQGSGTVVRSGDGWSLVLTAEHVVRTPGELTVRCDGRTVRASVVAADRDADLAVLLIPGDFPSVRVTEGEVSDGTAVTVYGMTSVLTRGTVTDRMTLTGGENLVYGTPDDSDNGDSGAGVFAAGELVGVHLGKSEKGPAGRPRAAGPGPVRKFLARVLADDGSFRAKPRPEPKAPQIASPAPQTGTLPAGALRTTSGRVLVPTGNGTYRYADECPNGKCPQR